ncbi:hypothetical protein ACIBL3_25210 [Kribbella sp. NPDC050124]|uniref:hypothetical protein n=1 Tax=Kribbella sp. NPDC050124 TaxID=3364114 RepID=UPI00378B1E92
MTRGWTQGDGLGVVAIVLAFAAPATLGRSLTVQTPLLETGPATVTAGVAMLVALALFHRIAPQHDSLRIARDGTLGPRLFVFLGCLWLLCPIVSIVRLAGDASAVAFVGLSLQLAAIVGVFWLARRWPARS